MGIRNHCIERRTRHISALLCQQIDDIELFECNEGRHDCCGGDDRLDTWYCDIPDLAPKSGAVQGSALI